MGVIQVLLRRAGRRIRDWLGRRFQTPSHAVVDVENGVEATGEVMVEERSVEDLDETARELYGKPYEACSRSERVDVARSTRPTDRQRTENTTVAPLHEHFVDLLDVNQAVTAADASHLAVGTDDTKPSSGDTTLGNEVFRTTVLIADDRTNDLYTETFLDTGEANGTSGSQTLREVGLVTDSTANPWFLCNHALIEPVIKNSDKVVTIYVTLQFRAG